MKSFKIEYHIENISPESGFGWLNGHDCENIIASDRSEAIAAFRTQHPNAIIDYIHVF